MAFWRSKAGWQAAVVLILGLSGLILASINDAYEQIHAFMEAHEEYQLDEVIIALIILGFMSVVYSGLRLWDLNLARRDRDRAEEWSRWMARHDSLTKLLNRHALAETLTAARNSRRNFQLLLIDLDGFKKVNDASGHKAGDFVLEVVSERLKEHVPRDALFRYGGDEFVAIVSEGGEQIADTIVAAVGLPVTFKGLDFDIGASIGIASYVADGSSPDDCLAQADAAMYHAKASGKGRACVFDHSMQERQLLKAKMERDLREAIRWDQIKPYYQPIIDLQTGTVNAFEALARWEKLPGVFVPPCDFIPVAEEVGLIGQLSDQLLLQACRDALSWPEHVLLSFNISPAQLSDRGLGLRIVRTMLEAGLTPPRLEIEITETALVKDLDVAAHILNDLHEAGVRVALDDFGTGYSSLAQLSNFRFDKIKIDRSFVSSFKEKAKQEKIVKAIVGLGAGLDVSTTAEGIETVEQLASLLEMGCTFGQGYLFGKALPADQAASLMKVPTPTGAAA